MMSATAAMTEGAGKESEQAVRVWGPGGTKLTCFDRQLQVSPKRSLVSRDQMGHSSCEGPQVSGCAPRGSPWT